MENAVVAFPFLHLPISVQQRVTRNMECLAQLLFSLLSKRTKSLIKSLKVKANFVDLQIGFYVQIDLRFPAYSRIRILLRYGQDQNDENISVERVLEDVILAADFWEQQRQHQRACIRWVSDFREWLLHILDVYHDTRVVREVLFSNDSRIYNLGSIKAALQGVETRMLAFRINNERLFKDIANLFLPTKRLMIKDYQAVDKNHLQRVLQSNFDFFGVAADPNSYYASLDRLVTINASSIAIECPPMTSRTFNKFLKLWMKGAMPRLKRLSMIFTHVRILKKDAVLNGVHYIARGEDEETSGLFEGRNGPEPITVRGGLSIRRSDGMEATIELMEHEDNVIRFNFYVWSQ